MNKLPNSIVLRTSLSFALLTATVVLLMGIVVRISIGNHFIDMDNQQMKGKLELITNLLDEKHTKKELSKIRQQLENALIGHHDLSVKITDKQGTLIFSTNNTKETTHHFTQQQKSITSPNILTRRINSTSGNYNISVVIDISHHQKFLSDFEWYLLLIGIAGTITMAFLGWFAAKRGLQPIHDMAQLAATISAQQLDGRLPITDLPIELHSLALSFNNMLERLESSFQRLTEFSSDIAHELRTPINNLMTQTQVSLTKTRNAEAYREVLYNNLEEYERLARMIADMLFLAKADNNLIIPSISHINIRDEVTALIEFFDALAEENAISFSVHGNAIIQGDKLMIRRALSNLLVNAIQHSYKCSIITIRLENKKTNSYISIENYGDAVNPEKISRLFDRFYRIDTSRQHHHEGAGLGLAITQSIIQAHGGKIHASCKNNCIRFDINLPIAETITNNVLLT
jgi:two-component system heavy metal sensor histidine kinase CusS